MSKLEPSLNRSGILLSNIRSTPPRLPLGTRGGVAVVGVLLLCVHCTEITPLPDDVVLPSLLETPQISSVSLECNSEIAQWRFEVEASAWTGGGTSFWTLDGEYIEQHQLHSISAAEDGTHDKLRVDLGIVADWRDATPGQSTVFLCTQQPALLFELYDTDGEPVDCRTEGLPATYWDQIDGMPSCPDNPKN